MQSSDSGCVYLKKVSVSSQPLLGETLAKTDPNTSELLSSSSGQETEYSLQDAEAEHLPSNLLFLVPKIHSLWGNCVYSKFSQLSGLFIAYCSTVLGSVSLMFQDGYSALAIMSAFQPKGRRKGENKGLPPSSMTSRNCTHHFY